MDLYYDPDAIVAELRDVLAPLLRDPWIDNRCLFCSTKMWWDRKTEAFVWNEHAPGCPTHREDDLLGRHEDHPEAIRSGR